MCVCVYVCMCVGRGRRPVRRGGWVRGLRGVGDPVAEQQPDRGGHGAPHGRRQGAATRPRALGDRSGRHTRQGRTARSVGELADQVRVALRR